MTAPWIMIVADGWYPIQPTSRCKPEDHGRLNDHVIRIEDHAGKVLWTRPAPDQGGPRMKPAPHRSGDKAATTPKTGG